ncbi:MAG: transglycosylase domain-containing protein [Hyphomicrobiales bacterium]
MWQPGPSREDFFRRDLRVPFLPRPLRIAAFVVLAILLLPYVITPLYRFVNPVSTVMLWRWVTGARVERTFMPIARMSPALPLTVIISEDGRFCGHPGVDLKELQEAIADAEDFDDLRGGSTITQQVAKNLFLWPGRSIVRKVLEFPLALWIDLVLPKRRVLEIYLNIAEWGPNGQFGAEAGSRRAFGKSARDVTPQEAAMLAATLPNPIKRNARQPGPGLQRLAALYVRRAASAPTANSCIR